MERDNDIDDSICFQDHIHTVTHSDYMTVDQNSIYMAALLYFMNSEMVVLVHQDFGGAPASREFSVTALPHSTISSFSVESSWPGYYLFSGFI